MSIVSNCVVLQQLMVTLKYLRCYLRSRKLWLLMDQKQQNTRAHLVPDNLIEMEDTEK
jgi:Trm5-related predicted tRNA methylase